jgi:hypothetical protein
MLDVNLCCTKPYIIPTILDVFGLRFYFYSEEHEPIHVHVENDDGRAKYALTKAFWQSTYME